MTLLTPAALLGLLLLPVLVALHLRRRQARTIEVPSLILWDDVSSEPARGGKHWQLEHLLLLLLQLIAVAALVLALARPAGTSSTPGTGVYVIDTGALMRVADPAPSRLDAARTIVSRDIQSAPSGSLFTIVEAGARPRVLVSTTDSARALSQVRDLTATLGAPDLARALSLAAEVLPTQHAHLLVVYAQGETLPALTAAPGVVTAQAVGSAIDNQSIETVSVRCTVVTTCDAFAEVRNDAATTIQDTLVIQADGAILGQQALTLPARSNSDLSFTVPAAHRLLQLYLARRDLVASDNLAWASIPAPTPMTVTLVGAAKQTASIAKALAALPRVTAVVRTPSQFTASRMQVSGPLVLAGWMPSGALPAASSILLVNPPRFPGAPAPGTLYDATISGEDIGNPLLAGVDLTSLDIPQDTARQYLFPQALRPVVWTPVSPLIVAGSLDGQRVAVLTFDPLVSNLSQLTAFPVLIGNALQWFANWLPSTALLGGRVAFDVPPSTTSVLLSHQVTLATTPGISRLSLTGTQAAVNVDAPGVYTVQETGAWGTRSAAFAVNANTSRSTRAASPIVLPSRRATADVGSGTTRHAVWWPWLGLLAAATIAAEWLLATVRRER